MPTRKAHAAKRWKARESYFETQMRKKEEELKELREELVKYAPTPLWKVVTEKQYEDIFETHILSELDELSFRVFREVNTESRDACRRSGRKLRETFELTTYSGNPPVAKKRPLRSREKKRSIISAVKQLYGKPRVGSLVTRSEKV